MHIPEWLHFFERPYPSANMVLIRSTRPVLIDSGFGSDITTTEALLQEADVPPQSLMLIANTHYHGDHVGGNHVLQQRYTIPIAAHRWDMAMINQRDREACSAEWLNQPIESYQINIPLSDGDEIDAGGSTITRATPSNANPLTLYNPSLTRLCVHVLPHGKMDA